MISAVAVDNKEREISGFHGGEYEDDSFPACSAV
jgi:hypothetical protein